MTGPQIPPHVTASVDQARAELADAVRAVREHVAAEMCEMPSACPGIRVAAFLGAIGPARRRALLYVALAELAAMDYGAPVHLTDAALTALAEKPKRRGWWSWLRR
ncbi:hypothetical protein [Micromonospora sediminicola]|uniref:hypothetical protein n=1 Tax=Micromonospora sediminicola TaxID=946078 RepID=UPI0037B33365